MDEIELISPRIVGCKFCPGGVDCEIPQCFNCGWNPDVAKERKAEIRKKRKEQKIGE